MNQFSFILIFTGVIFSCSGQQNDQGSSRGGAINTIGPAEFKEVIQSPDVQLLDVRTKPEVEKGKIPNAMHIDFLQSDFNEKVLQLDKEKPVALYCAVGGRSAQAARYLESLGFKKIYDLKGGINNYSRQIKK